MQIRTNKMIRWLMVLLVLLVIPAILLGCNTYSVFYYPNDKDYGPSPQRQGLPYQDIYFYSKDGTQLHAWFIPSLTTSVADAKGTVIHVHGNAANLTGHWPFVDWLPARGFNVFMFDYRGYGKSQGEAEPQGLLEDTQTAINYIATQPEINSEKLVLFGQSLGGNNAIAAVGNARQQLKLLMAIAKPNQQQLDEIRFLQPSAAIKALFIDSTFYSYSSIANDKIPGSGILFGNQYSAEYYLGEISPTPIMFIHCRGDRLIPYQHSQRLFDKAGQPKQLTLIDGGQHISAMLEFGSIYQDIMVNFFEQALSEQE